HVREPWSSGTSIGWDPRLQRDYYPIHYDVYQGEPHGDWVRKSAVPTPELLAELRNYASREAAWVEQRAGESPLRHCGPTLQRGQTELSEHPPQQRRGSEVPEHAEVTAGCRSWPKKPNSHASTPRSTSRW